MKFSWPALIISLLIIFLAASRLDLARLAAAALAINPLFLVGALSVWMALVLIKMQKWMHVTRSLGASISAKESLIALLVGIFVGVLTPGRIGDFVRAAYLKKHISWGKGLMAVVLDRAMDVLTLLGFAVLAIVLLSQEIGGTLISLPLACAVLIAAVAATGLTLNKSFMKTVAWPLLKRVMPASMREMIASIGNDFYDSIPQLKKNRAMLAGACVLGILAWLCTITMGWLLMRGLGLPLAWNVALLTIPIIALVEILPVSVIGIGTRELATVIVLQPFGVNAEHAVVFSLLYFAVGYIPSFLIGAYLFNRYPIQAEGKLKELLLKHRLIHT